MLFTFLHTLCLVMVMKKIYKFYKDIVSNYRLSLLASATSFYVIVAIFSFSILVFQTYSFFSNDLKDYLIAKILDVINPVYHALFNNITPIFSLNSFSVFLFLSLSWSSSKIINGLNFLADIVYSDVKKRKEIWNRISSLFMFFMLIFIIFFEIGFALYTYNIIHIVVKNAKLLRFIQFVIEIFLIFITLTILYIYAPPIKMYFKDVIIGSSISTALIYISSIILIGIIKLYQKLNISYGILTIISMFFLWIYIINLIISLGIIINYKLQTNGSISHNNFVKNV